MADHTYEAGQEVEVFSNSSQMWLPGEVKQIALQDFVVDGWPDYPISAGSVFVAYEVPAQGTTCKWILKKDVAESIRRERPAHSRGGGGGGGGSSTGARGACGDADPESSGARFDNARRSAEADAAAR
eukprot:CAMPEP_0206457700 /NCGR_PEP_ID=MMETSP0324_2-20121206/23124_1 /ASSEMBLY_ACC=CAM_ASM_000836 /TAXON_ID=2866 /ORGANISM="Crypthecodinium cohnii, Strain Seligo" /LENGTH=127 /DNA_ID=CAMNT_0053928885 /DNA_START=73 /DNA_END=456 /DNA_ORIENTATION=-